MLMIQAARPHDAGTLQACRAGPDGGRSARPSRVLPKLAVAVPLACYELLEPASRPTRYQRQQEMEHASQ
jgi:hypothetical protein